MVLNRVTSRWNEVLDSRIKEYLEAGLIVPVEKKQVRFVAPLPWYQDTRIHHGQEEVLDFTHLNRHIIDVERSGCHGQDQQYSYVAFIDIKSCYTNIKLHEDNRPYCFICWRGLSDGSEDKFYFINKASPSRLAHWLLGRMLGASS